MYFTNEEIRQLIFFSLAHAYPLITTILSGNSCYVVGSVTFTVHFLFSILILNCRIVEMGIVNVRTSFKNHFTLFHLKKKRKKERKKKSEKSLAKNKPY